LLIAGFLAFVFNAALAAIFVISVEMDGDACLVLEEFETGPDTYESICTQFKNSLQEEKYHHNHRMLKRNKYITYVNIALFLAITIHLFHLIPKWQRKPDFDSEDITKIVGLGLVVSIVLPLIFGFVLPPPIEWFPDIFREIRYRQVDSVLRELEELASYR
jgi:hypothetical protein